MDLLGTYFLGEVYSKPPTSRVGTHTFLGGGGVHLTTNQPKQSWANKLRLPTNEEGVPHNYQHFIKQRSLDPSLRGGGVSRASTMINGRGGEMSTTARTALGGLYRGAPIEDSIFTLTVKKGPTSCFRYVNMLMYKLICYLAHSRSFNIR